MEDQELFLEMQILIDKEEKSQRTIEQVLTYVDINGERSAFSHKLLLSTNFELYVRSMIHVPYLNALAFKLKHSVYFSLYKDQYHILHDLFKTASTSTKDIRNLTFNEIV